VKLLRALLRHTMTVEPYLGSSATGPVYGAARTVTCYVESKRRSVRKGEGRVTVSADVVWCDLDRGIGPDDRVTLNGRPVEVFAVSHYDGHGLPTPDHTELTVQ
jgi:hypothetical protein